MPCGFQILRRRAAAALAVPTVALGGCAGSGAPAGTGSLASTVAAIARGRPTRIYRVALSGAAETPAGPARARGVAIIAFHGQSVVCWRFAHLHGFTNATSAAVHAGATKRSGPVVIRLMDGPRFHHRGCVAVSPTVSRRVWGHPSAYYVNVLSTHYPKGAVRSQL